MFLALWGALAAGTLYEHPRFPVVGQVRLDGLPASGARVALHRLSADRTEPRAIAWGEVAADGRFELKMLGLAAGAPAGNYAVTVVYEPAVIRGEDYIAGPHVLAPELADPLATPLQIEVLPQANDLGMLALVTPRAPAAPRFALTNVAPPTALQGAR
ncbi:MAG: hypothetical protein SFU86_23065 [Pirellulaceae bacterium]|nr:hypothetical protein [Pirellulaceae bacterium]